MQSLIMLRTADVTNETCIRAVSQFEGVTVPTFNYRGRPRPYSKKIHVNTGKSVQNSFIYRQTSPAIMDLFAFDI